MATTHELLRVANEILYVQWKLIDTPTSFIWIIIFFDEAFHYGDC
jgi:hypothetical protein